MRSKGNRGFTLVELGVALMVIGLLLGGLLAGREMLVNVRVSQSVKQIEGVRAALISFREQYSALPGDMVGAGTRLQGCSGNCATNGDDSGTIGTTGDLRGTYGLANDGENSNAWRHLRASGFLSYTPVTAATATVIAKSPMPEGGLYFAYADAAASGNYPPVTGHYLIMQLVTGAVTSATPSTGDPALPPFVARMLDGKLDDAAPYSGNVLSSTSGTSCIDGTAYVSSRDRNACNLSFRIDR